MLDLLLGDTTTAPASGQGVGASPVVRLFIINLMYLAASACFIFGLKLLKAPRSARRGNMIAATGMVIAVLATLMDTRILVGGASAFAIILIGLGLGGAIGATLALKIHMRGMPQMVALLNGFGGLAAALVGSGEYLNELDPAGNVRFAVAMSIVIGMITFTGSLVAFAKLEEVKYKILGQSLSGSVMLPQQKLINLLGALVLLILIVALAAAAKSVPMVTVAMVLLALAAIYGLAFVLPIGGADMPVVIALLNSFSGLGAAATGFVLGNNALIIGGSLVGAAGLILTLEMSRAMNRSIFNILKGGFGAAPGAAAAGSAKTQTIRKMDADEAAILLDAAQHVIIVPGYGMAVAQAQHAVAELAALLAKKGASVKYAVHPVAGRMPGHMNVLLAEANVPYEQLADLEINPEFAQCDVALVIGANDVVNPAARHDKASPIYGMPIFDCDKSRTVMVCKRSMNPGYAGIENELFGLPNTVMLFGDAKTMVSEINKALKDL